MVATLALVLGFALWWIYFETLDGAPIEASGQGRGGPYLTSAYAHLPLTAGIAAAGMGVGHAIRGAAIPRAG